jgi:hypothetical protein
MWVVFFALAIVACAQDRATEPTADVVGMSAIQGVPPCRAARSIYTQAHFEEWADEFDPTECGTTPDTLIFYSDSTDTFYAPDAWEKYAAYWEFDGGCVFRAADEGIAILNPGSSTLSPHFFSDDGYIILDGLSFEYTHLHGTNYSFWVDGCAFNYIGGADVSGWVHFANCIDFDKRGLGTAAIESGTTIENASSACDFSELIGPYVLNEWAYDGSDFSQDIFEQGPPEMDAGDLAVSYCGSFPSITKTAFARTDCFGCLAYDNEEIAEVEFEYGTSTAFGSSTPADCFDGANLQWQAEWDISGYSGQYLYVRSKATLCDSTEVMSGHRKIYVTALGTCADPAWWDCD